MQARTAVRSAVTFAALVFCSATQAQSFRAYVSSAGSDANPCTVAAPCRLLPKALAAIADGGEVWMLDSANYNSGPVEVNKSATILAIPGAVGSVVALGGPAFNIATAAVRVVLRNLVIVPFVGGAGTYGVVMTNGASLDIENCVIANMTAHSAVVVETAAQVKITDTVIRNVSTGIWLRNGARANITTTKITGASTHGVYVEAFTAGATTIASISDSVLSHNSVGAYVEQSGTSIGKLIVSNTTSSENIYGVAVLAGDAARAVLSVGNSTISGNTVGMYNGAGTLNSLGNNFVSDNTTHTAGLITTIAPR
jgi:nitrous oxidase accessory protein NosD